MDQGRKVLGLESGEEEGRIAVVIPCYNIGADILNVLAAIPSYVWRIYVVDDRCPRGTGSHVEGNCLDARVQVLKHAQNKGVGGAVVTGYRQAVADGASVVVKIDGDGQMDPALIPRFVQPVLQGRADYTKGNRFFNIEGLSQMPALRLFGNSVLSFVNKVSSGYWNVMDPTNGYTAIHTSVLGALPLSKLSERYFFESDMLFRLGTLRAVVVDVPMEARYADEESSLRISQVALSFPGKYLACLFKRLAYNYVLREFNAGTIELLGALTLMVSGLLFGSYHWYLSATTGIQAPAGTIMLAALMVILGFQLLLASLNFDIANTPRVTLHPLLRSNDEFATKSSVRFSSRQPAPSQFQ